jgi:hypothetical protein
MKIGLACALFAGISMAAFDAGAVEPIELEWQADGTFGRDVAVPAGEFVEACGKLPAKAKVAWRFEAGGPVDFNIHFHEGSKVVFPEKKDDVAAANGTLDAPVAQDYCWMWTNKGPTEASVRLQLARH